MSKGTDSTGSTGRFGPRYGVRIRRRIRDIEEDQRDDHLCPGCGHEKVTREAAGVWQCEKCGHKFAGGAYRPETASFRTSQRQLKEALADEETDVEEGPAGDQVLDESETVAPEPSPEPAPEPELDTPEPEEPDVAEPEVDEPETDDELELDDEVPEVDVPELEDIPEVSGLDEEPEDVAEDLEEAPEDDADDAADDEDDEVVPEADLDLDRDDDEEA